MGLGYCVLSFVFKNKGEKVDLCLSEYNFCCMYLRGFGWGVINVSC